MEYAILFHNKSLMSADGNSHKPMHTQEIAKSLMSNGKCVASHQITKENEIEIGFPFCGSYHQWDIEGGEGK